MEIHKMRTILSILTILFLSSCLFAAKEPPADANAITVTVYNANFGVVK